VNGNRLKIAVRRNQKIRKKNSGMNFEVFYKKRTYA